MKNQSMILAKGILASANIEFLLATAIDVNENLRNFLCGDVKFPTYEEAEEKVKLNLKDGETLVSIDGIELCGDFRPMIRYSYSVIGYVEDPNETNYYRAADHASEKKCYAKNFVRTRTLTDW